MTLDEFLATASADHATALQEAQAYSVTEPKLYTANVMTVMLVSAGVYGLIADTATTPEHPVRDICMALMDRLRSEGAFNLSPNHPMGQANIQMLDGMIAGLPDYATELTGLKNQLLAGAEVISYPFARLTLFDIMVARDVVPTIPVAVGADGFVVVEIAQDVPRHAARLRAVNPRTLRMEDVARITFEVAGIYEIRIPHQYRGISLLLDDAYGAVS